MLIEKARAELYQTPEEQRQADSICEQLRSDCIRLLLQSEQNSGRKNLLLRFCSLIGFGGGISLIRSIGEPEKPVKVIVSSNTLKPEKAEIITIRIQGFQECLNLYRNRNRNYGEIARNIQVTGPRPNDFRRANLFDAKEYQEVITMIKE